jgi:nucleotide-binding universal stress UspA family protein
MEYTLRTILYATDLGPYGPKIFAHAIGLAQRFDAQIHIVHVLEPVGEYAQSLISNYVSPETLKTVQNEGYENARKEMHRRLEKFCSDRLPDECEHLLANMRVVEGLPFQVILDEAKRLNADLIVVGSHGRTGLGELFMGSVAHKVLSKATIPVFVVPIKQEWQLPS